MALFNNSTANNNTAIGYQAMYSNTTGTRQVAIGHSALYSFTTGGGGTFGDGNVAIGYVAGYGITSGIENTIVGNYGAAYSTSLTTGNYNVYIGAIVQPSSAGASNEIVIGRNAQGKGNSTGFIYPGGGGVYQGNNSSSWATTSDERIKKNIVENNQGLEKILTVPVFNFEYRLPEEITELAPTDAIEKEGVQLGTIAQKMLAAGLSECVKTESTGVMSVNTDPLVWYLINSIKQLNAKIDAQADEIATLKGA